MRKLLIGVLLGFIILPVYAQPIYLACQGTVISNTVIKKYPDLNKKNKRDHIYFNVSIEQDTKFITIGDSYFTNNLKYPNLQVSGSHYIMYHFWNKPNPDYAYQTISISIDRLTGAYELTGSSLTVDAGIRNDFKSQGACQVGVNWQPKF